MKHMIKRGVVNMNGIRPEMAIAFTIACFVYEGHGVGCRITCATDSKHGHNSRHYMGLALDLGTKHLSGVQYSDGTKKKIVKNLRERLGSQYDVVLEKDHIHIEYDPKTFVG